MIYIRPLRICVSEGRVKISITKLNSSKISSELTFSEAKSKTLGYLVYLEAQNTMNIRCHRLLQAENAFINLSYSH